MTSSTAPLPGRILFLLVLYSLVVFSVPLLSDRGLTIHESVLPQSARGMILHEDPLIPRFGTAPWLENPPLPQWTTLAICAPLGSCDAIWPARLGAVLAGTSLVIVTALIGVRLFGASIGVLAGFTMASSYLVVRYASLAEDEIYLALMVGATALVFCRIEFPRSAATPVASRWPDLVPGFFGNRPPAVWLFFVLLGLTNLTKGVIFGPAMAVIPIGAFLLLTLDPGRIGRYVWLWGWLVFALIGLAWPLAAYQQHPNALELWGFDLFGRLGGSYIEINQPWWYYLKAIPEAVAPWILVIPFGFWLTRQQARADRFSAERFIWVWALAYPLVLSIPGGKHQHYLLHGMVPWAILGALAIRALGARLPLPRRVPSAVVLFVVVAGLFVTGQAVRKGTHHYDAVMMREAGRLIPPEATVLADLDVVGLRGFHTMMYLPDRTIPLHNLTFLRGENIPRGEAYLVTRYNKRDELERYGETEVLLQSEESDRSRAPELLMTLFRLRLATDIERLPVDNVYISPMQAMYRTPGPYLGAPDQKE